MDTTQLRSLLEQAIALLPPPVTVYRTPADFLAAYQAAVAGDTLVLGTDLVYTEPFTLDKSVTLKGEAYDASTGRMTLGEPAPSFQSGIVATADNHELLGLELRGTETIGVMGGDGGTWGRCRLLGDPVHGAHRGIQFSGSDGLIHDCYMDDIFRPDQDTQAIAAWDCGPWLTIENCYLSAAGQSIMFGGADSSSAERIPQVITIHDCDCTKKPAWIGVYQCKCCIEFKAAIDVTVDNCRLEYAGTNQGQGAYLIDATVRNQDGAAPWSTVQNIEIKNCTGRYASGIVNFLGMDNNYPSGTLDGFNLHDCQFTDMDGILGHHRLFIFGYGPKHVTLKNLNVAAVNVNALGYFYSSQPPTGFVAQGLTLPTSLYGWFLDGDTGIGGAGHAALLRYMPDAVLDGSVV